MMHLFRLSLISCMVLLSGLALADSGFSGGSALDSLMKREAPPADAKKKKSPSITSHCTDKDGTTHGASDSKYSTCVLEAQTEAQVAGMKAKGAAEIIPNPGKVGFSVSAPVAP